MGASLVAQLVKNTPAMRETWVRFLGWEDPLEKGKAPTTVFWLRELHVLYSPWGHKSDPMSQTGLSDFHFETCGAPDRNILLGIYLAKWEFKKKKKKDI